jgi:hypothetical protein
MMNFHDQTRICHAERSEAPVLMGRKMLHFAQHNITTPEKNRLTGCDDAIYQLLLRSSIPHFITRQAKLLEILFEACGQVSRRSVISLLVCPGITRYE